MLVMENLMLILNGIGEIRSSLSVDRFFNIFFLMAMPEGFSIAINVFRYFGTTLFVVLLAWYVTKKMASARGGGVRQTCNLSVVESIAVGGHAVVRLIKAGDSYVLIGVTKERITLLGEIPGEQITERELAELKMDNPFGKIMQKFINNKDTSTRDEGKNE